MTMFYKISQQNWDYIQLEGLIIFLKFTLKGGFLDIHMFSHLTHGCFFFSFQEKYMVYAEANIHLIQFFTYSIVYQNKN